MKLKTSFQKKTLIVKILLIASPVLLLSISYGFFYYSHNQTIQGIYSANTKDLARKYAITVDVYSSMSRGVFQLVIDRPAILTTMNQAVNTDNRIVKHYHRQKLYSQLKKTYEIIQNYNFRQLHFHEKNNKSFLRFHRPEKYGDDLTGIRYSVEYTNRERKTISGFEEGRIVNGYRFVFPLQYNNIHIGSVEVSISMKAVVEQYEKIFNEKAQFIIKTDQVLKKVFVSERENYSSWKINKAFSLDKAVSPFCILKDKIAEGDKSIVRESLNMNLKAPRPFCLEVTMDSKPSVLTFLPIYNIQNEHVAYVFTSTCGDELNRQKSNFYTLSITMLILIFLLIGFAAYYVMTQSTLETMATYDSLTGIFSRAVIMDIARIEFEKSQRYRNPLSAIMFDIDHFKQINDSLGHQSGDLILTELSALVKTSIRRTDSVGRYGGEEFIVILPSTGLIDTVRVAENIRLKIEQYSFSSGSQITVSCGISEKHSNEQNLAEWIKRADDNLYRAKREGRNRVIPPV